VNGPGLGIPDSLDDARRTAACAYGAMLGNEEETGVRRGVFKGMPASVKSIQDIDRNYR
jgi:hypothetical protein